MSGHPRAMMPRTTILVGITVLSYPCPVASRCQPGEVIENSRSNNYDNLYFLILCNTRIILLMSILHDLSMAQTQAFHIVGIL